MTLKYVSQLSTVKLSVEYTTRTASQQHQNTTTMDTGFILDIEGTILLGWYSGQGPSTNNFRYD